MTDKSAKQRAQRLGLWAETKARALLRLKGYRILDSRARTKAGEIDIIARRGGVLAFIEVKARATREAAAHALDPRQQDRIVRAAGLWRARRPWSAGFDVRFDVVWAGRRGLPRHVPDAWRPGFD
ncbi:MAG: YraN family protein [Rhodospirillales bacterium]